jgi:predicted dinucleotide-binding enzyme
MKICIFGAGNIGGTLGGEWASKGHEVVFVVREPGAEKVQSLLDKAGDRATAVSDSAVVAETEAVLFAIPGRIMPEIVAQLGDKLNGKILIDATNNVSSSPMHQLDLLHKAAPDSPLFRAFSNLGWENFAEPVIDGQQVDLFYCGDDGPAQPIVHDLIADIGLRPVYIGDVQLAGAIDGLTRLWFALALQQGYGRHLGFKMLIDSADSL